MPVLLFYLLIGEPIAEITLVEGVSLGIDAFVIERMLTGREDALYLVGQPATVAGRVAQKLGMLSLPFPPSKMQATAKRGASCLYDLFPVFR